MLQNANQARARLVLGNSKVFFSLSLSLGVHVMIEFYLSNRYDALKIQHEYYELLVRQKILVHGRKVENGNARSVQDYLSTASRCMHK
jgi:hypothetical protein